VHPDEVVALGAAVLAASFGAEEAPTLVDVLPVPIGVAMPGGNLQRVLARNAALPCQVTVVLEAPAGKPLEVAVFQGERPRAAENEFLGSCTYVVPSTPGASRKVEVTFVLDTECLLTLRAKIVATGQERRDRLSTQQTSDAVLASFGGERIASRQVRPNVVPAPAAAARAPAKRRGFWAWIKGH
jgi:molecular chaperone DnaK